jgi:RNA polymerase sigma-70 factor, ECF subfamily
MSSPDQFKTMVSEHYESLYRFAMSLAQAEADAADLTQQTFYVWATKGQQLRDFSKIKSWLFTTLHRLFLASRRHRKYHPHDDLEELHEQLPDLSPHLADQLDSSRVLWALGHVEEVYRACLALFYLEDYTYKEIAEILKVPLGTIKSRISRGIVQLRTILLQGERRASPDRTIRLSPPHQNGALVPVAAWN